MFEPRPNELKESTHPQIKFSGRSFWKTFGVTFCDDRRSHQRCSFRKSAFRNFAKFTVKHLCQSLFFNKAAALRPASLLKERLWHRCFPMNFAKFLGAPFLQNTFGRLLLWLFGNPSQSNQSLLRFWFFTIWFWLLHNLEYWRKMCCHGFTFNCLV